jgi:hypothetical protein
MGTAVATPQLRAVVERVAERHGVGISRYFGELNFTTFATPPAEKKGQLLAQAAQAAPGTVTLVVLHTARSTPEMNALVDMNNADQNTISVATHRRAELDMLLSPELASLRSSGRIGFINYAELMRRKGRAALLAQGLAQISVFGQPQDRRGARPGFVHQPTRDKVVQHRAHDRWVMPREVFEQHAARHAAMGL